LRPSGVRPRSFGLHEILEEDISSPPLSWLAAAGAIAIAVGPFVALLVTAIGIPRLFPDISPRLVVRSGLLALFAGTVVLLAALHPGAGPEIVFVPMLLIGASARWRRNSAPSPFPLCPTTRRRRSAGCRTR
jgi:hypothetical protein